MAQPQIFIGRRNLKSSEPANTAGVWKMYDMNQMRHYNFLIGNDASDPFFNNTALLIKSTAINGGRNNTFLDGSLNTKVITRNGDANQGSFSPYAPNWSVHFDGTGDYLTVASSAQFAYGTGDFTWECWIFPTSATWTSSNIYILDHGSNGGTLSYNGNKLTYYNATTGTGSVLYTTGFGAVTAFQWTHIAAVRSSGTTYLYKNGVLSASATDGHNYGNQAVTIGEYGTLGNAFTGYISNLRLVKGTAVYTSAFTPPTSALTAITNTSLLTCRQNRFMDSSTNAFTITVNGDSRIDSFSPFKTTNFYTAYNNGGSIFFDGSGDFLESAVSFGGSASTNFTIEGWLYRTTTNGNMIMGNSNYSNYISDGDTYLDGFISGGAYPSILSVRNAWTHFAVVRNGSTVTWYKNGAVHHTATTSVAFNFTRIGAWQTPSGGLQWQGYMADIRVLNGTAQYTSTFTPPTQPSTSISNTVLLLSSTNYNIFDATQRNNISTNGDAQNSTAIRKDEASSISFDGTGDTLLIQDNPMLRPDSGNFTLEFWVRFNNISGYQTIIHKGYTGANAYAIQTGNGNGRLIFYIGGAAILTETGTGSAGTWIHYAIVRDGNNYTMYRDGVSSVTATNSTNLSNNSTMVIGDRGVGSEYGTPAYPLNGYIENLRFTKGIARYTANFTPPTIYYTR
jgi:hypothetical protein